MDEFWLLILVLFFATNSLDKAESVQLFDEIFGEGWWDNDKAEEWHKLTLEQNALNQIDRQNTQLGQIEPNSTDQNPPLTESDHYGQIEANSTDQNPPLTESDHYGQIGPNSTDQNPPLTESDHYGQIGPNSTDQNPPLTESNHSDNAKNAEEQNEIIKEMTLNENIAEDERKRKIVGEFNAMKDTFKQKGKYSNKEWVQIEKKIAKHLKVYRSKIYKWKKEFGISQKVVYEKEERKHLIEKFDKNKAELKRNGIKNSHNELDEIVAKKLGLSFTTINRWKSELGQTEPNRKYSHIKQKELMKLYYETKDTNPKIRDEGIAKMLKIGKNTLFRWKKQFKRQQFHPTSVDGHSVDENGAENLNLGV